jgi:hypothetical protein
VQNKKIYDKFDNFTIPKYTRILNTPERKVYMGYDDEGLYNQYNEIIFRNVSLDDYYN